jgi:lysozyme family protein
MAGQNPIDTPLYAVGGRYDIVARHVLGIEGGLSSLPADHGGITNYGTSLRFLQAEGRIDAWVANNYDLDGDGDLDGADIRKLTPEEAVNLFYHCIWCRELRMDLQTIPAPLDGAVFDQAVNDGSVAAIKLLQTALNRFVVGNPIGVDGAFGPQSFQRLGVALKAGDPSAAMGRLLAYYRQAAEDRYNAIVRADPSQVEFLAGWVARARSLGDV